MPPGNGAIPMHILAALIGVCYQKKKKKIDRKSGGQNVGICWESWMKIWDINMVFHYIHM